MAQNTISDELNRLIQAKADIKSALEEKGLTIGDSSTLDEFPGLIQEMEVGGNSQDTSALIDLIERDIQELVIPEGTTKIGAYGLAGIGDISISYPSTLNTIGPCAFAYSNIKNFTIPSSVKVLNTSAFSYSNFSYIDIPNTLQTIDVQAFAYSNCTGATWPTNYNSIGYNMFYQGKLKKFMIPNNVTNLGNGIFSGCPLEDVIIGSGITNIPTSCFYNFSAKLNNVTLLSTTPPTVGNSGLSVKSTTQFYVPSVSIDSYKTAIWFTNVSTRIHPIADVSYDNQTYTVQAIGKPNLELYIDASLCDSSVYTFPVDNRNHTIEVKSVDPSFGLLDSSTMTVYIGEPQYMALTCSDPNGATVSMTQTLGNNSGVNVVDMKYSTDGTNWNNWTHTDVTENDSTTYTFNTISLNEGDKVYFKGDNSTGLGYTTSNTGNARFVLNGNLGASGNVMSLLYDDDFQEYNSVPNNGLSSLFTGCTSLTTAPELPATTLGVNCYSSMFYGCTSLTTAPELPATTLGNWCYSRMFQGCTSLNYVKAMFTAQDAATHTQYWLNNVSATGTFVKNPEALWSESDIIPSGWIVEPFDYTLTPETYNVYIPAAKQGNAGGQVTINADDYNNNDYVLATKISGWPPYDTNGGQGDEGEITPIKITLYEAPTGTMTLSNGSGDTQGSLTQDANNPLIYWYNITDSQKSQDFEIMLNTANAKFKVSKVEFNYNEFSG